MIVLMACAMVAVPAHALVCPRSAEIGNYLNYLQLYFENDDQIFSFSNDNSKIVRMYEEIDPSPASNANADTYTRREVFLVKDDINKAGSPLYLYMIWAEVNKDEILKRIVNYGRFQVDPRWLAFDGSTNTGWTDTMIYKLIATFFNINNADIKVQDSKYNNANEICKAFWPIQVTGATGAAAATATANMEYCADPLTIWKFAAVTTCVTTGSATGGTIGICDCKVAEFSTSANQFSTYPSCTFTWKKPTSATSYTRKSENNLNPDYVLNVPTLVTTSLIGKSDTLIFDSMKLVAPGATAPEAVVTSTVCDPSMMKLEYDNFYYLFSNYYKNGIGKQVPAAPSI